MIRQKGLGRGLDALLGGATGSTAAADRQDELPLEKIQPGRYQPRTRMDQTALAELAASIRAQGLMQPLLVRPIDAGRYELIAGERRWRAARIAGLEKVPVLVRDVPDNSALAMALIENIQREDLNPVEEAMGVSRLVEEFRMTHEQAADAIGRSRPATTNLLRLLRLAKPVQTQLMEGAIEMGHARALLGLDAVRQIEIANRIATRGLSVRETEAMVAKLLRSAPVSRRKRVDRDLERLSEELSEAVGTTIEIHPTGRRGAGRVVVHYANLDHLEELTARLRTPAGKSTL